jgi:hypothetical protein
MTDTPSSRPSSVDRATRHGAETRAGWLTPGAVIAVVVNAIGTDSAPSPARAPLGTGSAPSRVGTASIHGITTLHH